MSWWMTAIVVLSLGLDNLVTSVALGASGANRRIRISLLFGLFEALMPAIGLVAGGLLSNWIGGWAWVIGLLVMLGMGIYMLVEDDDEDEKLTRGLKGWALVAAAVSISADELAVGASFGLLDFPVGWTLLIIGAQAFCFSYIGLRLGARLKPYLGERVEKAAGLLLILTAVLLGLEHWVL
jgi:manganese efflux pump family protein